MGAWKIFSVLALVSLGAFFAGKLDSSHTMVFMVGAPARAPNGQQSAASMPVVSAKEILTGKAPVGTRTGEPVLNAEQQEMRNALKSFGVCNSYCCRRDALARAIGAAALVVGAPALAADDKVVLVGADNGNLQFVPDEVTICKGDGVTWKANKALPHNIVFDVDAVPDGVDAEKIGKAEYLSDPGETFAQKFSITGTYEYYCEPHRGAGMAGKITVTA
jgi:plastocyanin